MYTLIIASQCSLGGFNPSSLHILPTFFKLRDLLFDSELLLRINGHILQPACLLQPVKRAKLSLL